MTGKENPCLRQAEITKELGMPSRFDPKGTTHLAVRNSLFRLLQKGEVKRHKGKAKMESKKGVI